MANDITNNPLVLDTAAATDIITNLMHITAIKFTVDAGGTDNDTCVLENKVGKVIYEEILNIVTSGVVQAPPMNFVPPLAVNGLRCTTLSGGKVYVYWTGTQPHA